ncbi:hypothetical protein BD309DRAFT_865943 [Dichomitus squalens]|uniref:Uncharacterized protein n=1 Tax=Dichomitus squalens TaxID=114155 RepID=A0A4Q9PH60_9APHY|nr:hypothetical protein BD309DRAFT_865943 [Dichomitus squalens]TBU52897.1 hypothetical protein BD310DRAFT_831245 [Dichomitus squalens]
MVMADSAINRILERTEILDSVFQQLRPWPVHRPQPRSLEVMYSDMPITRLDM